MITDQVQLKLSLSQTLNSLLELKAQSIGVPSTQYVKHLILKDVEDIIIPEYEASDWLEEKSKKAILKKEKAVSVKNVKQFFDTL